MRSGSLNITNNNNNNNNKVTTKNVVEIHPVFQINENKEVKSVEIAQSEQYFIFLVTYKNSGSTES